MSEIRKKVKDYIIETFLFGAESELATDTSFLDEGIIDSTGVLELVEYLEKTFGVTIEDEELLPDNLDSLGQIETFITQKKQFAEDHA